MVNTVGPRLAVSLRDPGAADRAVWIRGEVL